MYREFFFDLYRTNISNYYSVFLKTAFLIFQTVKITALSGLTIARVKGFSDLENCYSYLNIHLSILT